MSDYFEYSEEYFFTPNARGEYPGEELSTPPNELTPIGQLTRLLDPRDLPSNLTPTDLELREAFENDIIMIDLTCGSPDPLEVSTNSPDQDAIQLANAVWDLENNPPESDFVYDPQSTLTQLDGIIDIFQPMLEESQDLFDQFVNNQLSELEDALMGMGEECFNDWY